jgi:hypothetical protein
MGTYGGAIDFRVEFITSFFVAVPQLTTLITKPAKATRVVNNERQNINRIWKRH